LQLLATAQILRRTLERLVPPISVGAAAIDSAVLAGPNHRVGLRFRSRVSMLIGMDNNEFSDAAVEGRAEHREEVV
jgi:hypothetical protein